MASLVRPCDQEFGTLPTELKVFPCLYTWNRDLNRNLKTALRNEPRYEKTGFLHMRKQRRRSAAQ